MLLTGVPYSHLFLALLTDVTPDQGSDDTKDVQTGNGFASSNKETGTLSSQKPNSADPKQTSPENNPKKVDGQNRTDESEKTTESKSKSNHNINDTNDTQKGTANGRVVNEDVKETDKEDNVKEESRMKENREGIRSDNIPTETSNRVEKNSGGQCEMADYNEAKQSSFGLSKSGSVKEKESEHICKDKTDDIESTSVKPKTFSKTNDLYAKEAQKEDIKKMILNSDKKLIKGMKPRQVNVKQADAISSKDFTIRTSDMKGISLPKQTSRGQLVRGSNVQRIHATNGRDIKPSSRSSSQSSSTSLESTLNVKTVSTNSVAGSISPGMESGLSISTSMSKASTSKAPSETSGKSNVEKVRPKRIVVRPSENGKTDNGANQGSNLPSSKKPTSQACSIQ